MSDRVGETTDAPATGMLRKNITITREQNEFLERHPEINQSALFRQVIDTLMTASKGPKYANVRDLKLGRAVYRSGAFLFNPRSPSERPKRP